MKAPCGPQRASNFRPGLSGLPKTKGRRKPSNDVLVTRRTARGDDALSASMSIGIYRPDEDARHWVKAALVVRIIFHPSASRFAISGALSAVIPHATL